MAHSSERVKLMKNEFMSLHKEGFSIAEIAQKFHISKFTIYDNLQDIADANKVSREELLARPHKQHEINSCRALKLREEVNPKKLSENFSEIIENANTIILNIDSILASEQEEIL